LNAIHIPILLSLSTVLAPRTTRAAGPNGPKRKDSTNEHFKIALFYILIAYISSKETHKYIHWQTKTIKKGFENL
jgi:hypothetical protein